VTGFSDAYGVPFVATRGGAETMYPEYREKLKTMTIPPPKTFINKFAQEHAGAETPKEAAKEPAK